MREICAFTNASGGKIFISVTGDGEIKGVKFDNETRLGLQDSINNIEPSLLVDIKYQDTVIIVAIPWSKNKPYACKNGFFMRIGPNSQKITRN